MHYVWRAPLTFFLLCREIFTNRELREARTLEYFTTLPDAALLLHPGWRTQCVWLAMLAFFLVYSELFSNCELFTNHELSDACTSALPNVTYALRFASSARTFPIVL